MFAVSRCWCRKRFTLWNAPPNKRYLGSLSVAGRNAPSNVPNITRIHPHRTFQLATHIRCLSSSTTTSSSSSSSSNATSTKSNVIQGSSSSLSAATMALAVFGGAFLARWWYSSTLDGNSVLFDATPRQDQSKVSIVLPKQKFPTKALIGNGDKMTSSSDGSRPLLLSVDRDDIHEFLQTQQGILNTEKTSARERTRQVLHGHLEEAFSDCKTRGVLTRYD